jgi:hypothetical protein
MLTQYFCNVSSTSGLLLSNQAATHLLSPTSLVWGISRDIKTTYITNYQQTGPTVDSFVLLPSYHPPVVCLPVKLVVPWSE